MSELQNDAKVYQISGQTQAQPRPAKRPAGGIALFSITIPDNILARAQDCGKNGDRE
jgi:hypothetical protein